MKLYLITIFVLGLITINTTYGMTLMPDGTISESDDPNITANQTTAHNGSICEDLQYETNQTIIDNVKEVCDNGDRALHQLAEAYNQGGNSSLQQLFKSQTGFNMTQAIQDQEVSQIKTLN